MCHPTQIRILIPLILAIFSVSSCMTVRGNGSKEIGSLTHPDLAVLPIGSQRIAEGTSRPVAESRPVLDSGIDVGVQKSIQSCYEAEKTKPKPVCFSCDDAVRILNAKERLKAWPARCQSKLDFQKKRLDVECNAKIEKEKARTSACYEKHKILMEAATKSCKTLQAHLVGAAIGTAIGIAVGVLGTVISCYLAGCFGNTK